MLNLIRELTMRVARLWNWNKRNARFYVILGGPGAGKDTITELLAKEVEKHEGVKLPVLIMGDIFRRHIAEGTPIGKKWQKVVESGGLVPDKVVLQLLKIELKRAEYDNGAILNGIPRKIGQARGLRRILMWRGNKVNRVVLLDAPEGDLEVRLTGRRFCPNPKCGKKFHTVFNPPKVEETCDFCGTKLDRRKDDDPVVIKDRLKNYNVASKPLYRFYEYHGLLTRVPTNNQRTIQEVLNDVVFTIEQFD